MSQKKKVKRKKAKSGPFNIISGKGTILPLVALGIIIIVTYVVFSQCLNYEFLNWDDDVYVTNNPLVTSSGWNFRQIFSQQVGANYHPFTILTLIVNFKLSGINPSSYHLFNIILHLMNTALVYVLIYQFSNKQSIIALVVAVIFALHPMHVESVVWISERKDVLFTCFYLSAFITWIYYERSNQKKIYLLAMLLFVCALLSKPTAVTLPVLLLGYTLYTRGKIRRNEILKFVPFFILSIVFGLITILIQTDAGAAGEIQNSNIFFKMCFASYGLVTYLVKFFVPTNLSAFYPYPELSQELLPVIYYLSFGVVVVSTVLMIVFRRKVPHVVIGMLFFIVTIGLTLQFFTVGSAIIADRYTYVPYIGISYIIGYYLNSAVKNKNFSKSIVIAAPLIILFAVMIYLTNQRIPVWKDSNALWRDVISKDERVSVAWNNLGLDLKNKGNREEALTYFEKAITIDSTNADAYNNKGLILKGLSKHKEAIEAYTYALEMDPGYYKALINRGIAFMSSGNNEKALSDISAGLKINPSYNLGYLNRAAVHMRMNNYNQALKDYDSAILLNTHDHRGYNLRGSLNQRLKKHDEAIRDYSRAIVLNPNNKNYYTNRARSYKAMGMDREAAEDMKKANR